MIPAFIPPQAKRLETKTVAIEFESPFDVFSPPVGVISIGYLHCSPESFHVNLASRVQYLRWSGNEQRLAHGGARLDGCVTETDHSATTVEQPESGFSDVAARTASRSSVSKPTDATTPPMPLPGIIGNSVSNGPKPLARNMVSTKVMLANDTSINACPGPGTGSEASAATSTSGPPNSSNHTAFITVHYLSIRSAWTRASPSPGWARLWPGDPAGGRVRRGPAWGPPSPRGRESRARFRLPGTRPLARRP